jgi:hypothetical protein
LHIDFDDADQVFGLDLALRLWRAHEAQTSESGGSD